MTRSYLPATTLFTANSWVLTCAFFWFVRPIKPDQQRGDVGKNIILPHLYFLTVSLANHRQLLWRGNGFHIGRGETGMRWQNTISRLTIPMSLHVLHSMYWIVLHTSPVWLTDCLTKRVVERISDVYGKLVWQKGLVMRVICRLETREETLVREFMFYPSLHCEQHGNSAPYSARALLVTFNLSTTMS